MSRRATGKSPGRPRIARNGDGEPDPVVYIPSDDVGRALRAEVSFYRMQKERRADDAAWPVLTAASQVAREADVTPRAVQKWRKKRWYQTHFWSAIMNDKLVTRAEKAKAAKALKVCRHDLVVWIAERWPDGGFVDSPINGRRYHSPEKYAQHLRQEGAIPEEWICQDKPAPGI